MIPNIAIVQVNVLNGPNIWLWLPLFLLWIPAILLGPFILLVLLIACLAWRISFWRSIATFWALLSGLRGTDVRVAAEGNRVLVRIL
jgi:hypothetical protein